MPDYSAGEAKLRIVPDASDFRRLLEADMRKVRAEFTLPVRADTAQARADIARFRDMQGRDGIALGVDVDTAGASAKMDAWRARQRANSVLVKVDADTGGALSAARNVSSAFSGLADLKVVVGLAGVGELPALATGLASVAAAIQQVAQAGLLLPGIIGGATASVGTLLAGLSGIGDALTAVNKLSDDGGRSQADAARAAQSATDSYRNAVQDETRAQKDRADAYRDARRNLEDLNTEARGGVLDEKQAILDAQRARRDLAQGGFRDSLDMQAAQLRVEEADQRVVEVHQRNIESQEKLSDANAKGIEGSDLVVAANERVTRATQSVAQAQSALQAATSTSGPAADAAAQAMARLSPNAQEVVRTLADVRGQAIDLRNSLSQPMLEGISGGIRTLIAADLPTLKSGLGQVATAWNGTLKQLMTSLGSDQSRGLLDRILGNTAEAQTRFTAAINPLIRAFGTLTAAGSDALPRLADDIGSVADRFAVFIEGADKDGRLDRWINEGIDGFEHIGNTLLNLGRAFTAITNAVGGGGGLLASMETGSRKLAEFLNSTEGQNKLKDFFEEGRREIVEHIIPILQSLPGFFAGIYQAGQKINETVVPPLRDIAHFLGQHPELVKKVIEAFVLWKGVNAVTGVTKDVLGGIGSVLETLGTKFAVQRQQAENEMERTRAAFEKAGGNSGVGKLTGALNVLGGIGGPVGMAAVTVGVPLVITALDHLNTAHDQAKIHADALKKSEDELADSLDNVTGKLTQQSRNQAIKGARDYDAANTPTGDNRDGLLKGDAIKAATELGIPPDVYADALMGNQDAVKQVRDVLNKNNITPELSANKAVSGALKSAGIDQDLASKALLGDPDAVKRYGEIVDRVRSLDPESYYRLGHQFGGDGLTLADVGKALSPTGRESMLASSALNDALAPIPGATDKAIEANQADKGRFRPNPAGSAIFGPDARANASDSDVKVSVPNNPDIIGRLQRNNIPYVIDPGGGGITATVPLDSPLIEKYSAGGPVGGLGNRDSQPAMLTPGEHVLTTADVAAFGGQSAVYAFRNSLHRGTGGDIPDQPHLGTGAPPGPMPIAPAGGPATNNVVADAVGGAQSVFNNAVGPLANLLNAGGPKSMAAGTNTPPQDPASYLGGWAGKFGASFISEVYQRGVLGFFGLEGSILSPTNPWFQDAAKGLGIFNTAGDGTTADGIGSETITLGDGNTISRPTYGTARGGGDSAEPATATGSYKPSSSKSPAPGSAGSPAGAGPAANKALAQSIFSEFFPASEWGAFDTLEMHEAGYNSSAKNPSSTAYGMGQFLDTTWAPYGAKTSDPATQIRYMLRYIKDRYGTPSNAWAKYYAHPGGVGWYAHGGPIAGGKGDVPTMLTPGEHVFTREDVAAMGGQDAVYDMRRALHLAPGGGIPLPLGVTLPNPAIPNIKPMIPRATPAPATGGRPAAPSGPARVAPTGPAPLPAPIADGPPPPAPATMAPIPIPANVATPEGAPPQNLNHNLAAVNTAIESGANALGQAASTALGIAGAAGGMFGGGALGAAGPYIAGAIKEGGKVVEDGANVVSSLLVGNVPGSFGDPSMGAYGDRLIAPQKTPQTAQLDNGGYADHSRNYHIQAGYKVQDIVDALDLRDSREAAAGLAQWRG